MKSTGNSWTGALLRRCVRWIVARFYPRLEITGGDRVPRTGPVLVCANHANSLLDPVLVGMAARRPVRFLAKAPLFDVPILGELMRALGMLPAYRGSDDATQVRRNLESLDIASQALIGGQAMGIFPEGKSHDIAHLETIKSGAARIAMGAVEGGAKGVQVLPIGVNYEHKERFRSAAWIAVAEPIDVDRWLAEQNGESRVAMRALTGELERRLKSVVVHLDEPKWAPFLNDLEVLAPATRDAQGRRPTPVRQRKHLADAMNHFLATDRPRAEAVGGQIAAYREAVCSVGLRVQAPILNHEGWPAVRALIGPWLRIVFGWLPALVGTLFHVVPFTIVRTLAARLRTPGRTTRALYALAVGVPVYGLWYFACGWWMLDFFTTWFAVACLVVMPVLGVIALAYWRNARRAASLAWRQLQFLTKRDSLRKLRQQRQELQAVLTEMAREYEAISPPPAGIPKPDWRVALRKRATAALATAALLFGGWFVWHHHGMELLIDPASGIDLAAVPRKSLEARLAGDEKALTAVLEGLVELEANATALQADFAAGRRSYANTADYDAVRQLLASYINYRTALVRLIWRYQRYAQLEDERLRLRSFLVGFTAANALYDASLKFVHQFNRSEETIDRLNEGEPVWGIPPGLYDTVQRNLANQMNIRLLEDANRYYVAHRDAFVSHGLQDAKPQAMFHAKIAASHDTAERLAGAAWRQEAVVATKDFKRLIDRIRYETQSAISTWIGDMKIREPRHGAALIQPAQLDRLRDALQPGDILLERRNWFLSNAFLPGYWPHAALYVGTPEDLQRLGLDKDPRVQAFWSQYAHGDEHGHPLVILEALSEGVMFNSLEHSIGGADAAAVLRPQLTAEEIREAIARGFGHAAKPYDFEFDFTSRDKLVCTEVVFRAYGANEGPIHFPVKQILGRQTMPAIELVRKVKDEAASDTAELQFVAFIDGDEQTNSAVFLEDGPRFYATLDRPALTFLQGFEQDPIRRVGPLGWSLIGLMGLFTVCNLAYYGRRGKLP